MTTQYKQFKADQLSEICSKAAFSGKYQGLEHIRTTNGMEYTRASWCSKLYSGAGWSDLEKMQAEAFIKGWHINTVNAIEKDGFVYLEINFYER